MALTLDLPPDLEARLNAEAARRGLSPTDYVTALVRSATSQESSLDASVETEEAEDVLIGTWPDDEPRPTTPAEVVAYWERHGLLGTRPDITDSLEHAREIRRRAERRERS